MGVSTSHVSMIGLILNTCTGSVTPQYHVIHDNWFATVLNAEGGGAVIETEQDVLEWRKLIKAGTEHYIEDEFDENGDPLPVPELHGEWLTEAEKAAHQQREWSLIVWSFGGGGAGHHIPRSSDMSGGQDIDSNTGINDNSLVIMTEQLASQEENPNANQNDEQDVKEIEGCLHY